MENKYEKLDSMIVERLRTNPGMSYEISDMKIRHECGMLVSVSARGGALRIMDRRLQALRKQGKIVFDRKVGWSLKP